MYSVPTITITKITHQFNSEGNQPVTQPKAVQYYKQHVFAFDSKSTFVWQIDPLGKTQEVIIKKGPGPGEIQQGFRNMYIDKDRLVLIDKQGYRINYFDLNGVFYNLKPLLKPVTYKADDDWSLLITFDDNDYKNFNKEIEQIRKFALRPMITDGKQIDRLGEDLSSDYIPFHECEFKIFKNWGLFYNKVGRLQIIRYTLWDLGSHEIMDKGTQLISDPNLIVKGEGCLQYVSGCTTYKDLGFVLTEERRSFYSKFSAIKFYNPESRKWSTIKISFGDVVHWQFPSFYTYLGDNRWCVFADDEFYVFETDTDHKTLVSYLE
jgi:hypothetical protein